MNPASLLALCVLLLVGSSVVGCSESSSKGESDDETATDTAAFQDGSCKIIDYGTGKTVEGQRHVLDEGRFVVCWRHDGDGPYALAYNWYRLTNLSGADVNVGVALEKLPDLQCKYVGKGKWIRWTSEGYDIPRIAVGKPTGIKLCSGGGGGGGGGGAFG